MAPVRDGPELQALQHRRPWWRAVLNRRNLIGIGIGCGTGMLMGLGLRGTVLASFLARYVYGRTEQVVPFTRRYHVVLLPGAAEALLGAHCYESFVSEAAAQHQLVDKSHPDMQLVVSVAKRLVAALDGGAGGGHRRHLQHFSWEIAVVRAPTVNAMCFPGGKIVVYTGLLELLGRDVDLLAMVMGHEVAHALARHSAEKMGMGLAAGVALSMLRVLLGGGNEATAEQRQAAAVRQQEYPGFKRHTSRLVRASQEEGGRRGTTAACAYAAADGSYSPGARHYPPVPDPYDLPDYPQPPMQQQQQPAQPQRPAVQPPPPSVPQQPRKQRQRPAQPLPPAPPAAPPQMPAWLSDELLALFSALLLELPFSRRAETEADLIGLKLMALAGYNTRKAPDAFRLMAQADKGARAQHGAGPAAAGALLAGLGCTHPDSSHRAQLLVSELEWMASHGQVAQDEVGSKTTYFAL